jgi:hypothetical protein
VYTVLPASQVHSAADRKAAIQLQKDLQTNNPDESWQIYRCAEEGDLMNPLERLYALCYRILGNQDTTQLVLRIAGADGAEIDVTAMKIMLDARSALDAGAGEP